MDCIRIEELLSPYLDQELPPDEASMVSSHLSVCAACQREYENLLKLSTACKYVGEVMVPAPSGFKDALMLRINEENSLTSAKQQHQGRIKQSWKQLVAGVAAAIMLFWGTVSYTPNPIVQVADKNPVVETKQPTDSTGKYQTVDNSEALNSAGNLPVKPGAQESAVEGKNNTPPVVPTASASESTRSAPVFLENKERTIITTWLQIKVSDSASALEEALKIAANHQAQVQNLGQQVNENGSYNALKITIAKTAANGLISELKNLGTVGNQEIESKDITTRFAEALSQYEALVNQQVNVQDLEQKAQLDKRIKTLENDLSTWDQNANQETIVLWLKK